MAKKTVYCIAFVNNGKVYELYAQSVKQGDIFGFIEISDFVFGETSKVVVDPAEERLKMEFATVKRSYIPMQAIIRIDEVQQRGTAKIMALDKEGKVTPFPIQGFTPSESGKK